MKKTVKLISIILAAILALSMLSACGGSKGPDVTGKYLCTGASINGNELGADGEWIILEKGGKGSYHAGLDLNIEWKLEGENLTVETKLFSETYTGTLKEGVIKLDMGGTIFTFAKEGTAAPQQGEQEKDVHKAADEVFDAGKVRALIPGGWYAIPQHDIFADDDNATLPNVINICKGGSDAEDLWNRPYIRIDYYGPGSTLTVNRDFYDETEDVEPLQCGPYTWEGFIETDYSVPVAILLAEDGEHQFQASITLKGSGETISLDDADVRAILASVEPSAPAEASAPETDVQSGGEVKQTASEYEWWDGVWYGWWAIYNGNGVYEDASNKNMCWDAYVKIKVDGDKGTFVLWDSGTTEDKPLISCDELSFTTEGSEHGTMYAYPTVFPAGVWNHDWAADPATDYFGWEIDPEFSSVSHFENMIELSGYYESPENPWDSFSYSVFLKPWGEKWDDVKTGDTTDCLYKDMMPVHYDKWYLPLLELGYDAPPATYQEGVAIVEAGTPAA